LKHNKQVNVRLFFLCTWLLAGLSAFLLGIFIMMAGLGKLINNFPAFLFGSVFGGLMGGLIALAQWLVLRQHIQIGYRWIVFSLSGWMIFWGMNMQGYFGRGVGVLEKSFEGLIHGLIFGFILGLMQYFALLKRIRSPLDWIGLNLLIWPVSAIAGDTTKALLQFNGPLEFIIAFPLAILLTGLGMWFMISRTDKGQRVLSKETRIIK
jgi:hypothetical protein